MLDVSRIVSGKLRLDRQPVDLGKVVDSAVSSVAPAAQAKSIEIIREEVAVAVVRGDSARLQQVVWNVLSNAVKFTPEQGTVRVRMWRDDAHANLLISDDGEGIDPEALPKVFDRFCQADSSASRRHGGLGLGLAIVRQLVELHGGKATIQSEGKGKGVAVAIQLPSLPADSAAPPASGLDAEASGVNADFAGVRILVVDDDADARDLVGACLYGAMLKCLQPPRQNRRWNCWNDTNRICW